MLDFATDLSSTLGLVADERVDIELEELLLADEAISDRLGGCLSGFGSTDAHVENLWLNVALDLGQSRAQRLLSVHDAKVGAGLEVWQKFLAVLVVSADLLREDSRSLVGVAALAELGHALLTDIFGAL